VQVRQAPTCHPAYRLHAKGLCLSCYNRQLGKRLRSRPAKVATCHPDRPHRARGLCADCYDQRRHAALPLTPITPTCHPDRPHQAKGLCLPCYDKRRYWGRTPECGHPDRYLHKRMMCRECYEALTRATCHPDQRRANKEGLCTTCMRWTKSGLTVEQRAQMIEQQGGACAICREPVTLTVDHDHQTQIVRGLLCRHCNWGLGQFKDNPELLERAALYVRSRE
jgi:hypothetical protein